MPPNALEALRELHVPYQIDDEGLLFVSADIVDWAPLAERKIQLVIDLDGEMDCGVPTIPNNLIYAYFPFADSHLPDLVKLHALGQLAAEMMSHGRAVLIHCAMGLNRSPLMAGVAMAHLGHTGAEALAILRSRRAGALFNSVYADYLAALDPHPRLTA